MTTLFTCVEAAAALHVSVRRLQAFRRCGWIKAVTVEPDPCDTRPRKTGQRRTRVLGFTEAEVNRFIRSHTEKASRVRR